MQNSQFYLLADVLGETGVFRNLLHPCVVVVVGEIVHPTRQGGHRVAEAGEIRLRTEQTVI